MKTATPNGKAKRKNGRSAGKSLLQFAGVIANAPDDLAANHDFYRLGGHKQYPRRGRWIPPGKALRRPTQAQVDAFNRKMEELAAQIEGLPPDLAKNLDHYLHGHPKK